MTFGRAAAGLAFGVVLALSAGGAEGDGIMRIEAGVFDNDDPNEAPPHRTYVRDFWIDRDTVTNVESSLRVTFRRHHGHRGLARGHHFIGFRSATSEDMGGR